MRLLRNSLYNDFLRFFDIAIATTDAQRNLAARLRHRVYSEELGYEPRVSSGREYDRYDPHAIHCVITHRSSGMAAGCVRLICPDEETQLALEDNCQDSLHLGYLKRLHMNRDAACEVSRLAVDPAFRRDRSTGIHRQITQSRPQCPEEEHQSFGLVWLGTFLVAVAAADLEGRDHMYAMMDASLPRLLRQAGIRVQKAGDFIEYHGNRAAFFVTASDAVEHLRPGLKPFYEIVKDELAESRLAPRRKQSA